MAIQDQMNQEVARRVMAGRGGGMSGGPPQVLGGPEFLPKPQGPVASQLPAFPGGMGGAGMAGGPPEGAVPQESGRPALPPELVGTTGRFIPPRRPTRSSWGRGRVPY